jgi:hypothetical protein
MPDEVSIILEHPRHERSVLYSVLQPFLPHNSRCVLRPHTQLNLSF